jgi:hypothetical protein
VLDAVEMLAIVFGESLMAAIPAAAPRTASRLILTVLLGVACNVILQAAVMGFPAEFDPEIRECFSPPAVHTIWDKIGNGAWWFGKAVGLGTWFIKSWATKGKLGAISGLFGNVSWFCRKVDEWMGYRPPSTPRQLEDHLTKDGEIVPFIAWHRCASSWPA